jgi:hypothetical protein
MDYNFKKFTKVGSKLGNYTISLSGKSFSFGFNSGFYTKENIKDYKKVVLFYDAKNKAVAFKFTNDEEAEGAFTVIHSNNGSTGSVTAKSFIINNGISEYSGKKKPNIIKDDDFGELFVINLLEKKLDIEEQTS